MLSKELYRTYVQILKDELVPAMGCTEPIAHRLRGSGSPERHWESCRSG